MTWVRSTRNICTFSPSQTLTFESFLQILKIKVLILVLALFNCKREIRMEWDNCGEQRDEKRLGKISLK